MFSQQLSPVALSALVGQKFPPTQQQAQVIGAKPGPLLVVAGAGAGKTETMANRVVWMVANGYATPDDVLGLTFTRKAAQQLAHRIRARLSAFASTPKVWDQDPSGELARQLESINPTVSTYDSYAGRLVSEYGLLLPVEPTARLITDTELFQIAWSIVENYSGNLTAKTSLADVTGKLLQLSAEIDNHMVNLHDIVEETEPFCRLFYELPRGSSAEKINESILGWIDKQQLRLQFLPLVRALKEELARRQVITFGEQMTLAARLAESFPEVGVKERRKFRVVMLDEYQDTSHAQRILLRSLFGGQDPELSVTAVGDPMQSIYGWRGATAANLQRFVADFPVVDSTGQVLGVAPKAELTTSFRNPSQVLAGANAISSAVFREFNAGKAPVAPLEALESKGDGLVELGWFSDIEEENRWVADQLAVTYRTPRSENDSGKPEEFTAAVLVRKKKHIAGIAEELQQRGIPYEIVGLSGLLTVPEVADMIAVARMLVNPRDNAAALRILTGPMVQLGSVDLVGLYRRAENLGSRGRTTASEPMPTEPLAKLEAIIASTEPVDDDVAVGLTDAIADLGEATFYTEEGYRRLRELSAMLRHLRTYSLRRNLTDLFADIEDVCGIRTEVLARQDPHSDGSIGTAHLDRFAAEVASFESVPGATLRSLLDYFDLALIEEDGLEPGEVTVRSERVQILTVHKAKGLEWRHVAVLHADNGTYVDSASKKIGSGSSTWITDITKLPSTLRGDARCEDNPNGVPILDMNSAEDRKELENEVKAHIAEFKDTSREEAARLFYVAVTRSEHHLMVTGSTFTGSATKRLPYALFEELKASRPEDVVHWADAEEIEHSERAATEAIFPSDPLTGRRRPVEHGADLVRQAMATVEETPDRSADAELTMQWQQDVTALLEEHTRLTSTKIEVPLGNELTATNLVSLKRDRESFAQRSLRPVPFKPNAFAKRGTAFHEWLERRFGSTMLIDDQQLDLSRPGEAEINTPEAEAALLAELQRGFLESEWADRTPEFVEQPFEVAIGPAIVRGRMDAVFHEGADPEAGWMVVDWKTGTPPRGAALEAAAIQLAVYRQAWAELLSRRLGKEVEPTSVRAAFYYVRAGFTYEPGKLPSARELAELLEQPAT